MKTAVVYVHPAGPLLALLGNPNCGKTALFNRLTGSRQKVANYAGVTVERKEGRIRTAAGRTLRLLDLPGTYGLHPRSPDEQVTRDVLYGNAAGEKRPDGVLWVVDATNLRRHLLLVLAARRLGLPCLLVLNMADVAEGMGLHIDTTALAAELGMPVVRTVAVTGEGVATLQHLLEDTAAWRGPPPEAGTVESSAISDAEQVQAILESLGLAQALPPQASDRIDAIVLHPVAGPVLLALLLFLMFQAVFAWAEAPMALIQAGTSWFGESLNAVLPAGWLRSLLVDGVVAGAGSVLLFLPQIVILFFFILVLEESGYLPRAAYLLDRIMGSLGLSGRSFIPLLSCFACAVPGIMATRRIADPRDHRVTMALAPLMTCSARLPVYALLIAAFVPARALGVGVQLQGLVLFLLYVAGIAGAALVAWVLKRLTSRGQVRTLMMELPAYHWPRPGSVALGLWQRMSVFLRRVGGIILVLSIVVWFLASYPSAPPDAVRPAIEYSQAGQIGQALAGLFAPVGFNWQIVVALVPAMAAREVVVSTLGTVYALSAVAGTSDAAGALLPLIGQQWSLATALRCWPGSSSRRSA